MLTTYAPLRSAERCKIIQNHCRTPFTIVSWKHFPLFLMLFGGDDDNSSNGTPTDPVVNPGDIGDDMGTKVGEGQDPIQEPHAG